VPSGPAKPHWNLRAIRETGGALSIAHIAGLNGWETIWTAPEGHPGCGEEIVASGGSGPVHELIWRLANDHGEESRKSKKIKN